MQFPIAIELRRSRLLSLLLVVAHALAAACVLVLPWPWALRSLLLVLISVSLAVVLRPSRIRGVYLCDRERMDGLLADGKRTALKLLPDSTVFRRLIVLRMRIGDEKIVSKLALLPDHMSAEQFRVLRLWLRWRSRLKDDAGTAF